MRRGGGEGCFALTLGLFSLGRVGGLVFIAIILRCFVYFARICVWSRGVRRLAVD